MRLLNTANVYLSPKCIMMPQYCHASEVLCVSKHHLCQLQIPSLSITSTKSLSCNSMPASLEAKFEPGVWLTRCALLSRLQNNGLYWKYLAYTCEQFLKDEYCEKPIQNLMTENQSCLHIATSQIWSDVNSLVSNMQHQFYQWSFFLHWINKCKIQHKWNANKIVCSVHFTPDLLRKHKNELTE